jgi:cyclophilin family peptidyl-prolyl cis-trans isomerase
LPAPLNTQLAVNALGRPGIVSTSLGPYMAVGLKPGTWHSVFCTDGAVDSTGTIVPGAYSNCVGDAGYYFDNETDPSLTFDVAGRLAMANAGQSPEGHGTNGSQFFITEVPYPDLNGGYTIFGQCDEHSVLVVASIARVDRDAQDKPREPVIINKVTVVREGQPIPPLPAAPVTTPK